MLHRLRVIIIFVALALPVCGQESPDGGRLTERAFLADTLAVEAGKPFTVAFHFTIADKWHMYWRHPGGVGTPLTVLKWNLPPGWKADVVEFPLPILARNNEYEQNFYAYEHEVAFPVKITPPEKFDSGEVTIGAKIEWQVCAAICIQGEADMRLTLPVGTAKPANAEQFTKWLAELPQTGDPPTEDITFDFKDKILTVRAKGLPAGSKAEFFAIPPESYRGGLDFGPAPMTEATPDGNYVFTFKWDQDFDWTGLLVVTDADGVRKGWYIGDVPPPLGSRKTSKTALAVEDDGETWDPFAELSVSKPEGESIWGLLLQGFLGGLLLNLMPCVLPVISLKIFGFVQQAGEAKERVFQLGLAFCAGVFAFFLALAVLVLGLASANKSLGWGAQFSNPIALTIMVSILFLFGLSLLGVFEITLGGGASSKLGEASLKEGAGGAFVHGFFTTLLGTSCTAPFIGPVLGTAINQPGIRIFVLFAAIATGLSLPYFLLTWKPAWMRFLPKPGMWMVRFKQLLGFVMLAFTVWLIGSLPTRAMISSVAAFLLLLAFAAWLFGTYNQSRWPLVATLLLAGGGWVYFIQGSVQKLEGQKSSGLHAAVRKGLNQGRPVFVDFTADWCLNCVAFEKLVINTEPVQAALKEENVLFVKADYTAEPPDISDALKKLNRVGVPVYVLFRKRGDAWIADGLTQGALLKEIGKL